MAEYLFCLNKNIENRFIDRIFILCEAGYRINMNCNKLKYFYIPERPKFCDFFKLINNITASDDINIISNSDIFFDESLKNVKDRIKFDVCYALTRWEFSYNGKISFYLTDSSQDTWIFKGKIKEISSEFFPGHWASDNKIAYEICNAGYKIKNPSFSIITYHLHNSGVRNYKPFLKNLEGPFKSVLPESFDKTYLILYNYIFKRNELSVLKVKFLLYKINRPFLRFLIKNAKFFKLDSIYNYLKRLYKVH